MDYLRRSARVLRLQKKIPNSTIRSKMQPEQSILNRIQRRHLKWYGHILRMEDSCWPKICQWTPCFQRPCLHCQPMTIWCWIPSADHLTKQFILNPLKGRISVPERIPNQHQLIMLIQPLSCHEGVNPYHNPNPSPLITTCYPGLPKLNRCV